jgi:hypothetical protein
MPATGLFGVWLLHDNALNALVIRQLLYVTLYRSKMWLSFHTLRIHRSLPPLWFLSISKTEKSTLLEGNIRP